MAAAWKLFPILLETTMLPTSRWVLLVLVACCLSLPAQEKKAPAKLSLTKEEQAVLDLTNAARAKEKLPPLKPNALLFEAARAHSRNMAKQEKLAHDLDDKTPFDRVKATGYAYSHVGENIAAGQGLTAKGALKMWMGSQGHRENILRKEYEEIGIGVARTAKGDIYYTQVFGTPLKRR
jgi:uncharacterized protein YkwD